MAQTGGIKRQLSEEIQNERFIYKADGAGHAIPPGQLAALSNRGRGAVPAGGDFSLEMGLRSPGKQSTGLSSLCLPQFWRKGLSCHHRHFRSRYYPVQRSTVVVDVNDNNDPAD